MKKGMFCQFVGKLMLSGSVIAFGALPSMAQAQMHFDDGVNSGSFNFTVDSAVTGFENAFRDPGQFTVSTTEFQYNQKTAKGAFHFANTYHEDEALVQIGATIDRFRLDAFSGTGKAKVHANHQYSDVDSFFFHGGNNQRYDFSGLAVSQDIGAQRKINLSYTNIQADNLEDREVYGIGITGDRFGVSFTQVDRGQTHVGTAFSASAAFSGHHFAFKHMEQANDATLQQLSYDTRRNGKWYQVALQAAQNPLYEAKTENKIIFSMGFDIGPTKRFYASETQEKEKTARNRTYIYGAVGIGLGIGLTSGSSGGDDAVRNVAQHDAAAEVLNRINPESVRLNREHGGYIYRNADGTYSSTTPILGELASITLPNPSSITPAGTTTTASYHTHGGPDPRYDNENFSPQDLQSDLAFSLDGYLGTPGGLMKYHNHVTGQIETITTIAN